MRVLYLHQFFLTTGMSGGTRSYELAKRLVAKGHDVQMVTTDQSPNKFNKSWSTSTEDGICVHWFPNAYNNKMGYYRRIKAFLSFALHSTRKMLSLKGDIVFATSPPLVLVLPAIFVAKWLRIPLVFEVRDLWPEAPIHMGILKNRFLIFIARKIEKWGYESADHIVAVSPAIREHILLQFPLKNVTSIPNGCDLDLFAKKAELPPALEPLRQRKVIVYAGAIGVANNVSYIVQLAKTVSTLDSSVAFLILGTGKEEFKVKHLASALGLMDKSVFFHSPIKKEYMSSVFALAQASIVSLCDVKVLWTGSPNKIADSFSSGLPVFLNFGGWLAELIEKRNAGLRLSANDFDLAAKQLMDVLNSPQRLSALSRNSKELGEEVFSRELLAPLFENVLLQTKQTFQ